MDEDDPAALRFPEVSKLELDELIDELVERAQGVKHAQGRLRSLLSAMATVTSDLELEVVLRNAVVAARELSGARYGALGVIAADGHLQDFVHLGVDEATAAAIGHLPRGEGLLGALIADPRAIRLTDLAADERAAGFPAGHPPMRSFLGVPIRVAGEVFGNLYLTDAARGEFTAEDEELISALALAAATAIRHARTYEASRAQRRWLEASVEIAAQLTDAVGEEPLRTLARRAREVADADVVTVGTSADGRTLDVAVALGEGAEGLTGTRIALVGTPESRVIAHARTVRLPPDEGVTHLAGVDGLGAVMIVPLLGTTEVRGLLTLARRAHRPGFGPEEPEMAAGFARHAAVALELAEARASEQRLALLEDRDRIARDLHDHVIQELFAVGLSLQGMASRLGRDSPMGRRATQRVEDLDRTIRRIRTSIFELRGDLGGTSGGLRQSLVDLVRELTPALGFAPHLTFTGLVDVDADAELANDVCACVRETLTNVVKHAQARTVSVDVAATSGELRVVVADDGVGPPEAGSRRSGIANLAARAEKHGGTFELGPGARGGTVATWRVPTR